MGRKGYTGTLNYLCNFSVNLKKKKKKQQASCFLDLRPTESQFLELKPRTLHF